MNTPNHKLSNRELSFTKQKGSWKESDYIFSLSVALIYLSLFDTSFKNYFHKSIARGIDSWTSDLSKQNYEEILPQKYDRSVVLLWPKDIESAMHKTDWLINRVEEDRDDVRLILSKWYEKPDELPKAIIIGIAIGIIPGFTLGNIKKSTNMSIIVHENFSFEEDELKKFVSLSSELVADAISNSSNDIKRLEPDMHDWFFGERKTKIFKADFETLEKIEIELIKLGAPFKTFVNGHKLSGLIISPSVNTSSLIGIYDISETY